MFMFGLCNVSRVVSVTPEPVSPCLGCPLCHRSAQTRESAAADNDGNTSSGYRYIYTCVCLLCAEERKHLVAMPAMCRIVAYVM